MARQTLLAVPNVSEGRDEAAIADIATAFAGPSPTTSRADADDGVRLLDAHSDPDHHRSVFTLAGAPGRLSTALIRGTKAVLANLDLSERDLDDPAAGGQHPHVGALDVAPIVYLDQSARGHACAEALLVSERLGGELGIPVFLYGELADGRTRADLRRGGRTALAHRICTKELTPDFGPHALHPRAGATLVAARPPLVAFNLILAPPATADDAERVAATIREAGPEGIPGLRAIGVELSGHRAQLSMNVENPLETPLAQIVEAVRRLADVESAELVGLAPRAALENFPEDVPMPGFDPACHVIENRLGSC